MSRRTMLRRDDIRALITRVYEGDLHSLFRQGLMLYHHLPNWPEHRLRPLVEHFAHLLLEQPVYRQIFGLISPPI